MAVRRRAEDPDQLELEARKFTLAEAKERLEIDKQRLITDKLYALRAIVSTGAVDPSRVYGSEASQTYILDNDDLNIVRDKIMELIKQL
jgi:hypothetical protein